MKLSKTTIKDIGTEIAKERNRQEMTQTCLAYMLGYTSHSYISMIECGKRIPSLTLLCKLIEIFEVEINYSITRY